MHQESGKKKWKIDTNCPEAETGWFSNWRVDLKNDTTNYSEAELKIDVDEEIEEIRDSVGDEERKDSVKTWANGAKDETK